jgi:hypothetical protein
MSGTRKGARRPRDHPLRAIRVMVDEPVFYLALRWPWLHGKRAQNSFRSSGPGFVNSCQVGFSWTMSGALLELSSGDIVS